MTKERYDAFVMGRVTYERLSAQWADVRGNPYVEQQQPGKDLVKYGTSRLDDLLLRNHLVDELHLWYMPVVVGTGQRLFEDVDTSSLDLRLIGERRFSNGVAILSYEVR